MKIKITLTAWLKNGTVIKESVKFANKTDIMMAVDAIESITNNIGNVGHFQFGYTHFNMSEIAALKYR